MVTTAVGDPAGGRPYCVRVWGLPARSGGHLGAHGRVFCVPAPWAFGVRCVSGAGTQRARRAGSTRSPRSSAAPAPGGRWPPVRVGARAGGASCLRARGGGGRGEKLSGRARPRPRLPAGSPGPAPHLPGAGGGPGGVALAGPVEPGGARPRAGGASFQGFLALPRSRPLPSRL